VFRAADCAAVRRPSRARDASSSSCSTPRTGAAVCGRGPSPRTITVRAKSRRMEPITFREGILPRRRGALTTSSSQPSRWRKSPYARNGGRPRRDGEPRCETSGGLPPSPRLREEVVSAPRSPWQNPFAERVIGSIRRGFFARPCDRPRRGPRRADMLPPVRRVLQLDEGRISRSRRTAGPAAHQRPEHGPAHRLRPILGGLHHRVPTSGPDTRERPRRAPAVAPIWPAGRRMPPGDRSRPVPRTFTLPVRMDFFGRHSRRQAWRTWQARW